MSTIRIAARTSSSPRRPGYSPADAEKVTSEKRVRLRLTTLGCVLLAVAVSVSGQAAPAVVPAPPQFETRCGWFSNPTPANISLYDRDGDWTIGVQGGYQVEGEWDWPAFKPRQWVRTNGHYGHGCACLQLRVDKESGRVLEIRSARARPLAACRRDRALKKWERQLD